MLNITAREHAEATILSLDGDLIFNELKDAEELVAKRITKKIKALGLDCRNLQSLDSSGLGILIQISKDAKAAGISLYLLDIPATISKIFDISKLNSYFESMTRKDFEKIYPA